jgi:hypothetical protein
VTYETVLKVSNTDLSLRPGMTATSDITVKALENAILVINTWMWLVKGDPHYEMFSKFMGANRQVPNQALQFLRARCDEKGNGCPSMYTFISLQLLSAGQIDSSIAADELHRVTKPLERAHCAELVFGPPISQCPQTPEKQPQSDDSKCHAD